MSTISRLWPIVKRIYREFSADRIPTVAAGITFFVLLALFPAIAATVSLYGMFAERSDVAGDLNLIADFLPAEAVTVLHVELLRLASQQQAVLNIGFAVSLLIALWSVSGGFKALIGGLNVSYEVRETRGFLQLSRNAALFTIGAILVATIAVELGLALPPSEQIPIAARIILQILVWPALFLFAAFLLTVIYRFGPNRPRPHWRWMSWGTAIASLLWMIGTQAFSWFVQIFGSYNRVYGDLGAVVGFLTWIWLSLVILLLGAEINCELERMDTRKSRDRTP